MRTDVELLRIISAFGIVWFHSGYDFGRDVGYAGLIVFLVLSAYFAMESTRAHSVLGRAIHLIAPCVIWSAFYAAFDFVRGISIFPSDYSLFSKILSTPSIHLWYLPYIFFWIVVIDNIKACHPIILASLAALLVSAMLISAPVWRQWSYAPPFEQYMHAVPAIFVGVLFAACKGISLMKKRILLGIVMVCAAVALVLNVEGVGVTYAVGIFASLVLLRERSLIQKNNQIVYLSKLTFGIYLIHPFILLVLRHFGLDLWLLPVLGFVISTACIYAMFKFIPRTITKYLI